TIVRVDDPAALPLPNSAADPNNQIVGVDFSGGLASVASQLNGALGSILQFSAQSGTTLRVLNAPTSATVVNSVSATTTTTALAGGNVQLPLFTDGTVPFTGAITSAGSQVVGLAGRIAVNAALLTNPSALVVYQSSPATPAGDPTRPNFLLNRLTNATFAFSPATGIGGPSAPFT